MRFNKATDDSVEEFREDNLDASTRLFETKGEGPKLKARLINIKKHMLNIDPDNQSNNLKVLSRKYNSSYFTGWY